MKGAVNINTSTPIGRRAQNLSWQPALPPFETSEFNPLCGNSVPHHNVASSSETEKRSGGQSSPTTVLFESQWTTAFPGRARGDRVYLGPSAKAVGHRLTRILTLDLIRSEHTDDEVSNLSFCRQTARNGYVVEFSFFGSNVSPFFQTISATAAILRASVSRAISARIPLCWRPST